MQPKPTENSESQPNKPKTINLLESGFYKRTTKPCKIRLEMDWVQIDRIRHTNSTKYLPQTNPRTKCSYIDQVFLFTKYFSPSFLFLKFSCPIFMKAISLYSLPNTSQPSSCSISKKSFICLSHQGFSGDNRKGCKLRKHCSCVISP